MRVEVAPEPELTETVAWRHYGHPSAGRMAGTGEHTG